LRPTHSLPENPLLLACLAALVLTGVVLAAQAQKPGAADEPTAMQTARCLKAFELYRNGTVKTLLVTGGFTRDYISEARMMQVGLISLGVPAANVKAVARGEYRRLVDVAKAYADTSAVVLTTATGGEHLAPEAAPKWKVLFVE